MLDKSKSGWFITFTKEFEDVEEEVKEAIVELDAAIDEFWAGIVGSDTMKTFFMKQNSVLK